MVRWIITAILLLPVLVQAQTSHLHLDSENSDVRLTVYEGNFAVVKDSRDIVLPLGTYELEFADIARDVEPTSIVVTSSKAGLRIIEQSYRFDLLNKSSLLERFIGRKLKYSRSVLQGTTYEKVLREGTLLSINPEVVQFGDEIEIEPEGIISLPYFPEDLHTEPTLLWLLENKLAGEQSIMTTYVTNNMSWQADYIATLSGDESEIAIGTWVTINNASGKTFSNAKVALVSGQLNRVSDVMVTGVQPYQGDRRMSMANAESSMGLPTRQDFFEYHEYDVKGRTTLRHNERKQLKLMEALHIDVEKSYVMRSEALRHQMSDPVEHKFNVVLKFTNDTQQPLPAGRVRVFKANSQGSPQLAGEDRIGHVPVNDEVEITLGKAFDLTAEKTQTEFRRVGDRTLEIGHRVVVQNHKEEPVVVHLHEKVRGDWRVVKESHKGEKVDSSTLAYTLSLGKAEKQTVTYSVRVRW